MAHSHRARRLLRQRATIFIITLGVLGASPLPFIEFSPEASAASPRAITTLTSNLVLTTTNALEELEQRQATQIQALATLKAQQVVQARVAKYGEEQQAEKAAVLQTIEKAKAKRSKLQAAHDDEVKTQKASQTTVATYNVCAEFCGRGWSSWGGSRAADVAANVKASGADIVLIQEAGTKTGHFAALQRALGDRYVTAGYLRSKAIFYNPKVYSSKDKNGVALGTKTATLPGKYKARHVVVARLRHLGTGRVITVANTHLSNGGSGKMEKLRQRQIASALATMKSFPGPYIIGGDMNSFGAGSEGVKHRSSVNRTLVNAGLKDSVAMAEAAPGKNRATFQTSRGAGPGSIAKQIDHIYLPPTWPVQKWIISERDRVSDHSLVAATFYLYSNPAKPQLPSVPKLPAKFA